MKKLTITVFILLILLISISSYIMKLTTNSIIQLLERFVLYLEKERLNLVEIFIFLFCISLMRSWIEAWSLGFPHSSINNAHIVSFYFCVFAGGVLLLKVITREKLSRISNLICLGFLILPLAPLLDRFVFLRMSGYDYLPKKVFLDVYLSSATPSEYAGMGQMLILWIIVVLTMMYVYIKTHSFGKAVVNFFVFYFFILAVSRYSLGFVTSK